MKEYTIKFNVEELETIYSLIGNEYWDYDNEDDEYSEQYNSFVKYHNDRIDNIRIKIKEVIKHENL